MFATNKHKCVIINKEAVSPNWILQTSKGSFQGNGDPVDYLV